MHDFVVSDNFKISPTTLLLTLKNDGASEHRFSHQPGQYAAISFMHRGRPTAARCFSIVSSPTVESVLQFSMRTNGRYTKALTQLEIGDTVKVRGPFGGFVFDADRDKNTLLLAGGIGITPFMSMIRYATYKRLPNKITLIYSCRSQNDVPFAKELKQLEQKNPHFKVTFVVSQGPTDKFLPQEVETGTITPEIIEDSISGDYDDTTFFICGPQPFMRGMTNILKTKGTPANKIMTEAFSQGPNRQTGKIRSWPFNVYALSALGVLLSSFVVMVSDLLKTLPPSSIFSVSTQEKLSSLTNSRQNDLDSLVNGLPDLTNDKPTSDAASKALAAANSTAQSSNTTQTTPTTTPTTTSQPTTTQTPKCTTTQSGITTCY